jgi:SAM-dependent methyltransferase
LSSCHLLTRSSFIIHRSSFIVHHSSFIVMKLDVVPENAIDRIGLLAGLAPIPIAHALGGALLARVVMVATRLNVFEALSRGALAPAEVARICGSDAYATQRLLDALVSVGYLAQRGGVYRLTRLSRKWLLQDSPHSLRDAVLYEALEYSWLARLDEFVCSGRPLDFHTSMTSAEWALYQRGMRAIAGVAAGEVARRIRLPRGARQMLDVGGSHGYYAVALCRRHRRLRATVLDLPQAIEHAAPLLAKEGMGDRVVHRAGNALADALGQQTYDLVFISQLVHHFDDATNRELVRRAAQALRPGGCLAILEAARPETPGAGGQLAGLLGLYFAFTSRSGTWSLTEIAGWQHAAGLHPQAPIRLLRLSGFCVQAALKPKIEDRR